MKLKHACNDLCDRIGLSPSFYKIRGLKYCRRCVKAFNTKNNRCPCCGMCLRFPNSTGRHNTKKIYYAKHI